MVMEGMVNTVPIAGPFSDLIFETKDPEAAPLAEEFVSAEYILRCRLLSVNELVTILMTVEDNPKWSSRGVTSGGQCTTYCFGFRLIVTRAAA